MENKKEKELIRKLNKNITKKVSPNCYEIPVKVKGTKDNENNIEIDVDNDWIHNITNNVDNQCHDEVSSTWNNDFEVCPSNDTYTCVNSCESDEPCESYEPIEDQSFDFSKAKFTLDFAWEGYPKMDEIKKITVSDKYICFEIRPKYDTTYLNNFVLGEKLFFPIMLLCYDETFNGQRLFDIIKLGSAFKVVDVHFETHHNRPATIRVGLMAE